MKTAAGARFALIAIVALLGLRLAITLRTGAVTGDDVDLLADCFRWWRDGESATLATIYGSAGMIYVGFHHFLWATVAGLFSFHLGPLFLLHALLMVASPLALAWQLRGRPEMRWAVLLALSSPLAAYHFESLLPLWSLSQISGTILLQVAAQEERGRPMGRLGLVLVGVTSGYGCSIYPSLSALTLGVFLWLLLRRKPLSDLLSYLAGCVTGCLPYLYLLATYWGRLSPRVQVGDGDLSVVQLVGSIFRHFGVPYEGQRANSDLAWLQWEKRLSELSPWLWLGLAALCLTALVVERRARRRLPAYVQLAFCAWPCLLLFTAVTHMEKAYHQAGNLWWVPVVLVPWAVQSMWRERATAALTTLVAFNAACLGFMLGPRLVAGTTADPLSAGRGLGATWWMQERIIDEVRDRAVHEIATGNRAPLAVRCDEIYYIQTSIPKLFAIRHPELHDKVRWVAGGLKATHLLITREHSPAGRELRVIPYPDGWHREAMPARREIQIGSDRSWPQTVQLSVPLPEKMLPTLVLTARDGTRLPYWIESTDQGPLLWVKLPALAQGVTSLWAYYGANSPEAKPAAPDEVFDFFDDFTGDLARWKPAGAGKWEIRDGRCILSLPALPPDSCSAQLLLDRPAVSAGLIETRLRFPQFKTAVDAGVVFASRPGDRTYFWGLAGYGVTQLGQIDAQGVPHLLAWTANHWKGKANAWYVTGAEWQAGDIRTWTDGWTGRQTVIETIDLDESGKGSVGLGAKPGPGILPTPTEVEFDWVRIRTSFLGHLPTIQVGPSEDR